MQSLVVKCVIILDKVKKPLIKVKTDANTTIIFILTSEYFQSSYNITEWFCYMLIYQLFLTNEIVHSWNLYWCNRNMFLTWDDITCSNKRTHSAEVFCAIIKCLYWSIMNPLNTANRRDNDHIVVQDSFITASYNQIIFLKKY